jgi:phospholipid/cholesterol/gamma-HCH transport system substrate-binding protein
MRIHAWAVGVFLILGVGFFAAILFLIGNRHNIFGRHVDFYAEFSDVGGLPNGAGVRISGFNAGEVKEIQIPAAPNSKFRIKLQVDSRARGMVHTDSVVSIKTEGIVGDKYISVQAGSSSSAEAQDGATLRSQEPFDIASVMQKGTALLDNVDTSLTDLHGRLDVALDSVTKTVNHVDGVVTVLQPDLKQLAGNAVQITATMNEIVADLNAGKGPAGLLLKDEVTRRQLQATLSNVQQASANLSDASARANQLVGDFQSRELAPKVQATLEKVQATLESVQGMSQQLKDAINRALAPDDMGRDGATNIRETLSNLDRGTTNLAEDTEALKHGFLFRGFFKKRGFYDLQQLAPAEYFKACEREKGCTSRSWLDARDLFGAGSGGQEQLEEMGRQQIDHAVAPFVDSLLNHIVIVEGYSIGGTPDQQFVMSRNRAELVREYLQAHFHILHSDVGIVPLRDKPPAGTGQNTWNGVAIVYFEKGPK